LSQKNHIAQHPPTFPAAANHSFEHLVLVNGLHDAYNTNRAPSGTYHHQSFNANLSTAFRMDDSSKIPCYLVDVSSPINLFSSFDDDSLNGYTYRGHNRTSI
jgi:hypothetical protein